MSELNEAEWRELAIRRLREKRGFWTHALVFTLFNGLVVLIWAMTGSGFFWPVFLIGAWGLGLVMHWYTAFSGSIYTEEQVQKEIARLPKGAQEL